MYYKFYYIFNGRYKLILTGPGSDFCSEGSEVVSETSQKNIPTFLHCIGGRTFIEVENAAVIEIASPFLAFLAPEGPGACPLSL